MEERDVKRLAAVKKNTAKYALSIAKDLWKFHPDAHLELDFKTPLQLLVATILAAQSTDKRINTITPALFKKYRSASDYANADPATLEQEIKSSGFYRAKAKSLIGMGQTMVREFGGEVPKSMQELVRIPGVGRKTANVVLSHCFNKNEGIVVDTHVKRVAWRLGLTQETDADEVEQDLMKVVPRRDWGTFATIMTIHGRYTCVALKPKCEECPLKTSCPSSRIKA